MLEGMAPAPRTSLFHTLTRFDASQLAPWIGLRNAAGVALALAAGVALHIRGAGLIAATGSLDAAFSDGADPYLLRGRRMLAATLFVALAVFAGRLCGGNHALAVTLEAACAFAAGMLVATGETAGNIGTISLVTLIVFAAQPASLGKAFTSGLLLLAGGALQTLLSIALWPVRRYLPEARALGTLYGELARIAASEARATEAPPATEPILAARKALAGLSPLHSVESERYLALFSQAERMRLALLTLSRLRTRLGREPGGADDAALLGRAMELAARMLTSVAGSLNAGTKGDPHPNAWRNCGSWVSGCAATTTPRMWPRCAATRAGRWTRWRASCGWRRNWRPTRLPRERTNSGAAKQASPGGFAWREWSPSCVRT